MRTLNQNLQHIVDILSDGEYHDGTSIGEQLNITRSAIWKAIKRLKNYGVLVESVKGKGYVMREPLLLLNAKRIGSALTENLSQQIQLDVFETIDSTNTYLRNIPHNKKINVCVAEKQTSGKGRLDRSWFSPFGKNLAMSLRYYFNCDISMLAGISLAVALAVKKTLVNFGLNENTRVKWPNDIICNNKKIAGSLIEVNAESNGTCIAVIGVGINVNMLTNDNISQPWTSVRTETKQLIDRNQLCAMLITNLVDHIKQFEADGFARFIDQWQQHDYLRDQEISLNNCGETICGVAKGVNDRGHLVLQMGDGVVKTFTSGDASLVRIL